MAVALDDTLSGETSNTFCSVDYADDYFDNHYSVAKTTAWQALSDGQKEQLLIQACRIINKCKFTETSTNHDYDYSLEWRRDMNAVVTVNKSTRPFKYTYTQALQFPRNLDYLTDGTYFIPDEIKMAQCEQAIYLATVDDSSLTSIGQGLKRESVTVGEITLSQTYSDNSASAGLISPMAKELITPYLIRSNSRVERA